MSTSTDLGLSHQVTTPTATIRYRERGAGPAVVFVHGLLVNGDLWRSVVPAVAEAGYRCITPDWPLGSHEVPVPDADLSPPGVAALIADVLGVLELRDVTVIANDTGGALTQLLMTQHPERVGRVVLTSSDSFERFFPPTFAYLPHVARLPGTVWLLTLLLRLRFLHRLPITFGWLSKRPMERAALDSYLLPGRRSPRIRDDLRRFLLGVDKRHTMQAADTLSAFDKPVLLAWSREDRLFPVSLAERLKARLPNAQLELIDDAFTFVPEDRPRELSRLVVDFLDAHSTTHTG